MAMNCSALLQDFEALTPNLLARTIETVEGGGIIVLLLSNMSSLTQLYNLTMDVHARLRTESHQDVVGELKSSFVLHVSSYVPTCIIDTECKGIWHGTMHRYLQY